MTGSQPRDAATTVAGTGVAARLYTRAHRTVSNAAYRTDEETRNRAEDLRGSKEP